MKKHCGRFSLILRAGVLLFSAAVCLGKLSADPITLDNNYEAQSYVLAAGPLANEVTGDVNSLPYSTPISASDINNNCTLTDALTTSGLNFGFSEGSLSNGTDAQAGIVFQAGSGTTFSITGSLTFASTDSDANLDVELLDLTHSVYLYQYSGSFFDSTGGTLSLDSSGGSLSGALTSGDVYEFVADEGLSHGVGDAPSLVGSVDISFTQSAPNPTDTTPTDTPAMPPWALVALALLLLASASRYLPQPAIKT